MKNEHIARIAGEAAAKVAAEIAIEIAIEVYEKQRNREFENRSDRRLRNTKLLLDNYRALADHVRYAVYDIERAEAESVTAILDMMEHRPHDDSLTIESIKRTTARTAIIVEHIAAMVQVYRVVCESSVIPEDLRRYKVISSLYIDPHPLSVEELAESEYVSTRTIYRDRDIAVERLAALLFGLDGLQKSRS